MSFNKTIRPRVAYVHISHGHIIAAYLTRELAERRLGMYQNREGIIVKRIPIEKLPPTIRLERNPSRFIAGRRGNPKTYTIPFAQLADHIPAHPDRTAYKSGTGMNFDITFKEWPSRGAMLTTVQMQERSDSHLPKWKDWLKSRMGERWTAGRSGNPRNKTNPRQGIADTRRLFELWQISQTAVGHKRYDRLRWVAREYHKEHPESTAYDVYGSLASDAEQRLKELVQAYEPTYKGNPSAGVEGNPRRRKNLKSERRTLAVYLLPGKRRETLNDVQHSAEVLNESHMGQPVRYYTGTASQLPDESSFYGHKGVDRVKWLREAIEPRDDNPHRRRNSTDSSNAVSLYRKFHGKEPAKVIEIQADIERRKDYAALGKLVEMCFKSPNGEKVNVEFPQSDNVLLASNANDSGDGNQLYAIGGNQDMSGILKRIPGGDKDFVDLGELLTIGYFTRKDFDHFEPTIYTHKLGEDGGARPQLMYDALNAQLYFVGGEYTIKRPGIEN
jgi:hypothetical protein